MNILITGATGNIGVEVIRSMFAENRGDAVFAGVRNIEKAKKAFSAHDKLQYREFDFENADTFENAFTNIDIVFLLRPPHISNVKKYFEPLLEVVSRKGIKRIVFLSVQGAEQSTIIPHRKIELLVLQYNFEYIFIRPSYFMQNLTTTLLPDIQKKLMIILPSKDAKFNWVDISDIGEVSAKLIVDFDGYKNNAYEVTGNENLSFPQVVELFNAAQIKITYKSVNPFVFFAHKMREGMAFGMIVVMYILHFLPRVQNEPDKTSVVRDIAGHEPGSVKDFISRNLQAFKSM